MNTRLFVYGTLRRHPSLQQHATFLGDATATGVLFNLGSYPGLCVAPAFLPASPVPGELYEISADQWELVITQFDEYEGADYTRELIPIRTAEGELDAWAYIYTGAIDGFSAIPAWPPQ